MPSKSKAQHKFMAAVANNPKFAKQARVPQNVGREYMKADEGRSFAGGDLVKSMADMKVSGATRRADVQKEGFPDLNKDGKVTKADVLKGRGIKGFNMGGDVKKCPRDGIAQRGRTRGTTR